MQSSPNKNRDFVSATELAIPMSHILHIKEYVDDDDVDDDNYDYLLVSGRCEHYLLPSKCA